MKDVQWMRDNELLELAQGAYEKGVSIKDAKAKFHANNWMIDGKTIYWKKWVAMYYSCERSKDVKNYWS